MVSLYGLWWVLFSFRVVVVVEVVVVVVACAFSVSCAFYFLVCGFCVGSAFGLVRCVLCCVGLAWLGPPRPVLPWAAVPSPCQVMPSKWAHEIFLSKRYISSVLTIFES